MKVKHAKHGVPVSAADRHINKRVFVLREVIISSLGQKGEDYVRIWRCGCED